MTQREKSLLQAELQSFLVEYIEHLGVQDSANMDLKKMWMEDSRELLTRQALRVGLGVPLSTSNAECKTYI